MVIASSERSDIFVYQTNTGEYRVAPGTFVTSASERVSIRNLTGLPVTVTPPDRWPRRQLRLPPDGRREFTIPQVPRGVYFYHVTVDRTRNAVGHSEPTIIVDP